MNKFIICFGLLLFLSAGLKAQFVSGSSNAFDDSFVLITKSPDLSKVEGTPYLNEDFQMGTLNMKDKDPLSVFLRYDVVNERMEIKPNKNTSETYMLQNDQDTEYVIGNDKFVLDKINAEGKAVYGYFVELYDGENYRFLKKPVATLSEPVKARTGYEQDRPAEIEIEDVYYLSTQGTTREIELKNRKIKKAFSSTEANSYLKENKIRSEEDFVRFVAFLDQEQ